MNVISFLSNAVRGANPAPTNSAAKLPGAIPIIAGPQVAPSELTQITGGAQRLTGPTPTIPKSTDRPKRQYLPANAFEAKFIEFFPEGAFHKGRFNHSRRP